MVPGCKIKVLIESIKMVDSYKTVLTPQDVVGKNVSVHILIKR